MIGNRDEESIPGTGMRFFTHAPTNLWKGGKFMRLVKRSKVTYWLSYYKGKGVIYLLSYKKKGGYNYGRWENDTGCS